MASGVESGGGERRVENEVESEVDRGEWRRVAWKAVWRVE